MSMVKSTTIIIFAGLLKARVCCTFSAAPGWHVGSHRLGFQSSIMRALSSFVCDLSMGDYVCFEPPQIPHHRVANRFRISECISEFPLVILYLAQ
ncbi:hypothetical protein BDR05DRAFT_958376 [Suillus weaverae]|nr:hypothetical protein BDR05DRAFT_958376 [Suillus weaverae]